jgi:threonyl-tRNA synthetase
VGGREAEQRTITLRRYCVKEQESLPLDRFIGRMKRLVAERVMDNFPDVILGD